MEEELDLSFPEFVPIKINYAAVFDVETGAVLTMGPESAFINVENKISIDKEFFDQVAECKINIHDCFVDFYDLTLEIREVKNLNKIDDVLH
jgi:hypothetical protein